MGNKREHEIEQEAMPTGDENVESPAAPLGFGAQLYNARQQLGISLGDMAVQCRLTVAQLEAIEQEDVKQLPEPVYVRAFIRGYAHVLGLDPTPLVEDYVNRYAPRNDAQQAIGDMPNRCLQQPVVIGGHQSSRVLKIISLVVVILVVIAGIYILMTDKFGIIQMGSEAQKIEMGVSEAVKSNGEAATTTTEVAANDAASTTTTAAGNTTAPAPTAPTPSTPNQPATPAPNPNGAKLSDLSGTTTVKAEPAEAVDHNLTLTAKDPSWVRVESPKGKVFLERTLKVGETVSVGVPKGTTVRIGNAKAVTVIIDKETFSIARFVRQGVAFFQIQ